LLKRLLILLPDIDGFLRPDPGHAHSILFSKLPYSAMLDAICVLAA